MNRFWRRLGKKLSRRPLTRIIKIKKIVSPGRPVLQNAGRFLRSEQRSNLSPRKFSATPTLLPKHPGVKGPADNQHPHLHVVSLGPFPAVLLSHGKHLPRHHRRRHRHARKSRNLSGCAPGHPVQHCGGQCGGFFGKSGAARHSSAASGRDAARHRLAGHDGH